MIIILRVEKCRRETGGLCRDPDVDTAKLTTACRTRKLSRMREIFTVNLMKFFVFRHRISRRLIFHFLLSSQFRELFRTCCVNFLPNCNREGGEKCEDDLTVFGEMVSAMRKQNGQV
jgi:hypothetical protein